MKRTITIAALLLTVCAFGQNISLPAPLKNSTATLYQVLQDRHSVRSFKPDAFSDQILSDLLWAVNGVNRPDGRRTAPSAINAQDIQVYVLMEKGAYLYNAMDNVLELVTPKDLRIAAAGPQKAVAEAPVNIVLVSDLNKFRNIDESTRVNAALDGGIVSENLSLAVKALGLDTVVRAMMDRETLVQELGLKENNMLLLNHPVGYAK